MLAINIRWYSFTPPQLSMFSENVLANWLAEMSQSPNGECDIDSQRTNETSGSQQPKKPLNKSVEWLKHESSKHETDDIFRAKPTCSEYP